MNRLRHRAPLIALVLCVSGTPSAWAGAWTVPRHRMYVEYFTRYFGAKKDFDAYGHSRRKPKTAAFSDIRHELKLEYGLTDAITLLASAPYQSSHYRDDNTDLLTTGVGDIYLRTKFRVLQDPVVSSVQFSWKISGAYDRRESPALGDGQFDFESRLLVSRSFLYAPYQVSNTETRYAGVAFVNAEGGFTARYGAPANEFPIYLEAGVTPVPHFMVVWTVESVLSVRSTHEQIEDFAKWGVRGIWNVWGNGFDSIFRSGHPTVNLELGYNDVFAGRNTADAFEVFGKVGVSF